MDDFVKQLQTVIEVSDHLIEAYTVIEIKITDV